MPGKGSKTSLAGSRASGLQVHALGINSCQACCWAADGRPQPHRHLRLTPSECVTGSRIQPCEFPCLRRIVGALPHTTMEEALRALEDFSRATAFDEAGKVLATTFKVKSAEISKLLTAFDSYEDCFTNGLVLNDTQFEVFRFYPDEKPSLIYGRMMIEDGEGTDGICLLRVCGWFFPPSFFFFEYLPFPPCFPRCRWRLRIASKLTAMASFCIISGDMTHTPLWWQAA